MIVVVCAAFGLTVSEAKTEIMCLRAKGMRESTAIFSVEAAGQMYNKTNESVKIGNNVNHNPDLSIEVDRHIRNAWLLLLFLTFSALVANPKNYFTQWPIPLVVC